jgi:hypothetical protein
MDIEQLRQLDVAAVCSLLGLELDPNDHKQFKTDGFRIAVDGLKWFDHEAKRGGGGAIDLIMHVKQLVFKEAINYLGGVMASNPTITHNTPTKATNKKPTTPPKADNSKLSVVKAYLTNKRHLNANLVQWCIDSGMIYADSRANCVFRYGAKGSELRGTGSVQWRAFYGVKESGFILPAKNAKFIAVLESAIDALSFRQLFSDSITVSIAGDGNHTIINQVVEIAKAKGLIILSAFDNDKGGDIANKALCECAYRHGVDVRQRRPSHGKDWNEQLEWWVFKNFDAL